MFIVIIILYLLFFIQNRHSVNSDHIRIDCYMSFSNPIFYIKLFHYNPSGPPYLYATFSYIRFSLLRGNNVKNYYVTYHFKKIDSDCNTSVLFTTMGADFEKMEISITLHLAKYMHQIAFIQYTFYKGFKEGIYLLLNKNENIALYLPVLDVKEEYFSIYLSLDDKAESYLRSLTVKNDYLCVITENNPAVILHPIYRFSNITGFIVGFQAVIIRDGMFLGIRDYPAFDCRKNAEYYDESLIFVTDGNKYKIIFRATYLKYFHDNLKSVWIEFELANPIFIYVSKLKKIPNEFKKIFLVRFHSDSKECPDKSRVFLYLAEDRTIYLAKTYERVNTSSGVELARDLYLSPFDPCEENKN